MQDEMRLKINKIERQLLTTHPNWTQDKARWLAMQALGELQLGRR